MRLFVAIELPERIRTAVEDLTVRARKRLPKARWVRAANLHFTLSFLGEVEEARLAGLGEGLERACGRHPRFTLRLDGGGCFPPRGRARVVWIGLPRSAELERLQSDVVEAVRATVGVEPEARPYRPHLTVARCSPPWPSSAGRSWSSAAASAGLGEPFAVRDVALVRSQLGSDGPSYATLHRFPLGAGS